MNRVKIFFIGISILLITSNAFAQDNVVKLKLPGLAIGNLGLSYERVVKDNQSLVLNAGLLIPRKLPGYIVSSMEVGSGSKLSGFSIVPEYRFYTGKKGAPRGFYFAPYINVSNYSVKFDDKYENSDVSIKGGLFTMGAGVQFGMQWIISDVFTIDWTIFGLGINRYAPYAEIRSNDNTMDFAAMENDIKSETDGIPIVGNKVKTESGSDFLNVEAPIIFVGARSNFTIGIAF